MSEFAYTHLRTLRNAVYAMRAGNTRAMALEDTVPVIRVRCITSLLMRAPVKWERKQCALLLSTRDVRKLSAQTASCGLCGASRVLVQLQPLCIVFERNIALELEFHF